MFIHRFGILEFEFERDENEMGGKKEAVNLLVRH